MSDDIPEITDQEISSILKDMKDYKAPGEDGIVIETIKKGGQSLIRALKILFNKCLLEGTTPSQWENAIITILHKKVTPQTLQITDR